MTYTSTMGKDGRITLPKALRDELGLKPGDQVEFVIEEGRVLVRRAAPLGQNRTSDPAFC